MHQDDEIMFHQIKIYDGNGVLKKIIPPVTYGEWKRKKLMTRTPAQWAYWNLSAKELPS